MKIISGKYKGRNLVGFTIEGTRPTMDRVKESLFAMIQESISDAMILDLFSGSGNLGIEALSQGAKKAYLVDKNKIACQTIQKNIQSIGIENAIVLMSDYQKALQDFTNEKIQFDMIFLDPPYKTDYIEKSIKIITDNHLIKTNGKIICESDELEKIPQQKEYKTVKEKKYGDKYIVILEKI